MNKFHRLTWIAVLFCLLISVNITLAAANDNNVEWDGLGHNSRELTYRTPGGAVTTNTQVKLRLRAYKNDLTSVQMRLWNDRLNQQSIVNLTKVAADDTFEWWEYTLNTGALPTAYYYRFIAKDGSSTAYYQDQDQSGGWGAAAGSADDFQSWQLTVYDSTFQTPDWVKNAVIYQIFPDRFRDGDNTNETAPGTFFYNEAGGTIFRSVTSNWNTVVCDPRQAGGPTGCPGSYSRNFYGGDLQGVIDELDYLEDLGVTAIYFNPVFESPSNHKYDTTDYAIIDDNFGDLALFQQLATEADTRGIRIILDGVFNHTSSDSHYFDRYNRYGSFLGACESVSSPFRNWYFFIPDPSGPCDGPANYESWFGYDSLPKLRANDPAVRELIWSDGTNSIAPYWMQWADGWRLDVGGDVDPGAANDPNNDYWEGFRAAVLAANPDTYIVGEEWGNATSWLIGNEWDATMNYQYSSIMLSFWRDTSFADNDHNSGSSAGQLNPISPSIANERLLNWQERYPGESYYAQMNLLGSHDTSRPLFMLEHGLPASPAELTVFPTNPNYDWTDAITRLKGVVLMQMTLPGAPTIYYGDEVGLVGPQTWSGGKWEDDPYNRQPFPWLDESGTPFFTHLQTETPGSPRAVLLDYYKTLTNARNTHEALRTGSFDPLAMQDFPSDPYYVYGRKTANNSDAAVVFINRSTNLQNITVDVSGYLPNGATFDDALTPAVEAIMVSGGMLTMNNVPVRSGALLVLTNSISAPPAPVTDLDAVGAENQVNLTWSAAAGANSYDVYRSILSGGGYIYVGTTASTNYADTTVANSTTYYYVVVSTNTTTGLESGYSNEDSATPAWSIDFAVLQFPFTIVHTISATDPTDTVYGQVYIAGATDVQNTPIDGIRAQVGYGGDGTTPDDTWTWFEMALNGSFDFSENNDEYQGAMLPTAVGEFDYTVRFSGDNGVTWHYADARDGGGSPIGDMTVNASGDLNDPSVPQNLTVTGTTSSSISLAWDSSTDTRFTRAMYSYRVYRDEHPGSDFEVVGEVLAASPTEFTDESVTSGITYDYYVTAVDDSLNESAPSDTVIATAENVIIDVTFITTIPATTPDETIYIVGNQDVWGPWDPGLTAMTETSPGVWEWTGGFLTGTVIEFKHTRGNWEKVEKDADGFAEISHFVTVDDEGGGAQTVEVTLLNWRDPHVTTFSPGDGAMGVPADTTVTTTWNKDIDFDSGTFGTKFVVTDSGSTQVSGTYAWDNGTNTVTFTPDSDLPDGTYSVTVSGVSASGGGDAQQVTTEFTFTVGDPPTATPTETATPDVPTATPTETPVEELLIDGDVEADTDGDKIPDAWTGKNLISDKMKCNKDKDGDGIPDKIVANTGNCTFQFKGAAGENSKLRQDVELTEFAFTTGDTLDFTAFVDAKGDVNAKVKLQIKYTDATEKTKQNVVIAASDGYVQITGSVVVASSNIGQVRVQINHKSTSGRVRIDTASLVRNSSSAILLPAPGGSLRGSQP